MPKYKKPAVKAAVTKATAAKVASKKGPAKKPTAAKKAPAKKAPAKVAAKKVSATIPYKAGDKVTMTGNPMTKKATFAVVGAPPASHKRGAPKGPRGIDPTARLRPLVSSNVHRAGTGGHTSLELILRHKNLTVADYIAKGGRSADLWLDLRKKVVEVAA